jgi:hypothetical protein
MTQYNIYAGKKGEVKYLYTSLCNNLEDAKHTAEIELHLLHEITPRTFSWKDAIKEVKSYSKDISDEDLIKEAECVFTQNVKDWGEYNAVLTSEDSIPIESLILDYVVDNDCSDSSSTGN